LEFAAQRRNRVKDAVSGWTLSIFVDGRLGVLKAVNKHADKQTGSEKGAKQEKAVLGRTPGQEKHKGGDQKKFRAHGPMRVPFLPCISAFFYIS
jgi:hypothetical protein